MNQFFIVILILLLIFSLKSNAKIGLKAKAEYPYLLYLPKEYSTNCKNFPLVIYLGGGSQNGRVVSKLETYGHIKFTRLENEGHSIQYLYGDDKIFNWFLKYSK